MFRSIQPLGVIIAFAGLFFLNACEEVPPIINYGSSNALLDTTYMTTAPSTKDAKIIVIEEFTGAKCVNCPTGHKLVKNYITSNPDRVAAIAYHKFGSALDEPVFLGEAGFDSLKEDFRRKQANDIMTTNFGNVSAIPSAGFDRTYNNGTNFFPMSLWSGSVNAELAKASPVNLSAAIALQPGGDSAVVRVKGVYTANVATKQYLNVMLIEDDLEAPQEFPSYIDTNYIHNHVFRKAYTPASGYPLMTSVTSIEPGRAFEVEFKLLFEKYWNLDNCYLVIFVANNEQQNKDIQQGLELKIK